jgi:hypothetical protein
MEVVVKGAQDVLLTGNPEKSPFRHLYKRSSPFALCDYKSYFIGGNLTLFKRGDLLSKCYLMLEDFAGRTVIPSSWSGLFDTVDLYIGGQLIDSQDYIYSSFIWPALESDNISQSVAPGTFYPLRFFFCNSWSSALPIAGIKCHDVEFRITNPSPNYKFVLWQTFINLGDEERAMVPSEMVITQVQRVLTSGKTNYSELIGPVKYLASLSFPPVLSNPGNQNLDTSSGPATFTVYNTGGAVASWSSSPALGSLPAGMTYVSSATQIVFTVAQGTTIASTAFTVTATNASGSSSTPSFTVTAVPIPVLSNPGNQILNTNSGPATITVTNSGGAVANWSSSPALGSLPSGMTYTSSTTQLVFTIAQGTAIASTAFTVTGTNASGSSSTPSFTVTVLSEVSGSVSAYSYIVPTAAFAATGVPTLFSAEPSGSNVYFGGSFSTQTATPRSFTTSPTLYGYSIKTGLAPTSPYLLKYNSAGSIVGISNIFSQSGFGMTEGVLKADPGSNVYVGTNPLGGGDPYAITADGSGPVTTGVGQQYNIVKYSPSGAIIAWGGINLTTAASKTITGIVFDTNSNVYITGTYKSTTSVLIYDITGTPASKTPSTSASLPPTVTPLAAGGSTWPYLLKYGPDGLFKGYTILRVQNPTAGTGGGVSSSGGNIYWAGAIYSNIFTNVNSISTTEPTTNLYSLNTTAGIYSNAFIIKYDLTGTLVNFTEWGESGARASSAGPPAFLSSGSFCSQGGWSGGGATPLNNFGLANPGGTSPTYLPKSSVFPAVTVINGSELLALFNSSGVAQSVSQHRDSVPATTGGAVGVVVDGNDNIYQCITTGNSVITFYNLGNTTSGITVPASGNAQNTLIVKYNSSGSVVGYTRIPGAQTNSETIGKDNNYIYLAGIFINNTGGASVSNISSISSTPVLYTELPISAQRSPYMVKWSL